MSHADAPGARAVTVLTVDLPLPPKSLGKGAHDHWRTVRRDYGQYREWGGMALTVAMYAEPFAIKHRRFTMDIHWRFAYGRPPDDDNAITRCACYRDAAQDVGLVTDDIWIQTGAVTFERVKRGCEGVTITFREDVP